MDINSSNKKAEVIKRVVRLLIVVVRQLVSSEYVLIELPRAFMAKRVNSALVLAIIAAIR